MYEQVMVRVVPLLPFITTLTARLFSPSRYVCDICIGSVRGFQTIMTPLDALLSTHEILYCKLYSFVALRRHSRSLSWSLVSLKHKTSMCPSFTCWSSASILGISFGIEVSVVVLPCMFVPTIVIRFRSFWRTSLAYCVVSSFRELLCCAVMVVVWSIPLVFDFVVRCFGGVLCLGILEIMSFSFCATCLYVIGFLSPMGCLV